MTITSNISKVTVTDHPNMYLSQSEINVIKSRYTQYPWNTTYNKLISSSSDELYGSMGWAKNLPNQSVVTDGPSCGNIHIFCTNNDPQGTGRDDYLAAIKVGRAVRNLGIVYALTNNSVCADKAIKLINAWCLDSNTYMEPKEGNFNSRIELSTTMSAIFYGADLIWNYSGWNTDKKNQFIEWIKDIVTNSNGWIANDCYSPPCKTGGWCQNHENWRLLFRVSGSVLIDDANIRNDAFDKFKLLIKCQMDTNGSLKQERNRIEGGLFYSTFCVLSMVSLAEIAKHYNVDLYHYKVSNDDDRGLEKTLDFHAAYLLNPGSWPYTKGSYDVASRISANAAAYELAYTMFKKQKYLDVVNSSNWYGRPMNDFRTMGPVTLTHGST